MPPDLNQNIKHFPLTSLLSPPQAKHNNSSYNLQQSQIQNRTAGDIMAQPDPAPPQYVIAYTFGGCS